MSTTVYLNGAYLPRAEARVSVDDRGWVFGDGIYEVIRVVANRFVAAEAHLGRLGDGLRGLHIEPPNVSLLDIAARLLAENRLECGQASVYMQITRGAAPRAHQFPPAGTQSTVFVSASAFTPALELHERGTSAITYPDLRWAHCDLKTVNLLPNVLAKQSAVAAGASETVLIRDGVVDGMLRTHPRGNRILPGITRGILLGIAAERGIPFDETPIGFDELPRLQELFVSGTTTDVMPVVRLDGKPVGAGVPGPITRALQGAYVARLS